LKKVAITGASGFLGWHLVRAFQGRGLKVRAIVRPGNTKPFPEATEVVESALEPEALAKAADGCAILVHAAGVSRAPRSSVFEMVNVAGTRAAAEAANRTGARLVAVSSQAAIGAGTIQRPAREDDEPRPITPYGRSKLAAEKVVRSIARAPWTIVRPVSVYGPRDHAFLPLFRMAARGWFVQAVPASTAYTFIYVDDLAEGVALASLSDRTIGQTLFLGNPTPLIAEELLKALADAFGQRFKPWRVRGLYAVALAGELSWMFGRQPTLDLGRYAELEQEGFVCSVERARELLGFSAAVSLTDGIRRTAEWYRREGWIR
jgi:nucleoside-diphosphate-sugar epimerase